MNCWCIPFYDAYRRRLCFLDMQWLNYQDASHDLLLVLHSPNVLVLWNADTGTSLWRKVYSSCPPLFKYSLNTFDQRKLAGETV